MDSLIIFQPIYDGLFAINIGRCYKVGMRYL